MRARPEAVTADDLAGRDRRRGPRSKCPVAGRCRASTGRSTRTCRCRSPVRRRACPTTIPPACTAARSPCRADWARAADRAARRRRGVGALRARRTARRSGWARTRACRTSSTSPDVVEPGRTFELALTVVKWSDATYLEDQDHWYHAGLHRTVFLYATPPCTSPTCTPPPTTTRRPATDTCARTSRSTRRIARPVCGRASRSPVKPPTRTCASSTRPTGSSTSCASKGGARISR